ncbi:MAG: ABC transporter ATP-binding protein [Bacteroidales bacterium]|jgi:iron complex transport system ATP-binding protein|nr:ABC transporter ATP-binding protein [Bacteroidales bacterium]
MISIENLSFSYPDMPVIKQLSFDIQAEDFFVILGPNGAGKSTVLKLIARLLKASKKTISIDNQWIEDYSINALSRKQAYVSQNKELVFDFSVEESVLMGRNPYMRTYEHPGKRDKALVENILVQTNLIALKDRYINQLSGGELQRALVARALAQQTPIILLDEPLQNLDIVHQFEIMDLLKKLNQEQKKTIVMVLHDLSLAKKYASRVLLLQREKTIATGPTEAVLTEENIRKLFSLTDDYEVDGRGIILKK